MIIDYYLYFLWCTIEVITQYHCCVGGCDNDSRYPEEVLKERHVTGDLTWHYFPKDSKERALWVKKHFEKIRGL